ncbi:MAG: hypothetical protein GXP59_07565, partial [Deltaproteobacteria bacterium]|nr:hypothetical protein [Deltaproteobacteria bacterium]
MENIVKELRKIIPFKADTMTGDVVLVAVAEPQSFFYAVISDISRDESKRDEWWCVTMHILGLPPQKVVWILRESQFSGRDIFTMGGVGHFMQAVDFSGSV